MVVETLGHSVWFSEIVAECFRGNRARYWETLISGEHLIGVDLQAVISYVRMSIEIEIDMRRWIADRLGICARGQRDLQTGGV